MSSFIDFKWYIFISVSFDSELYFDIILFNKEVDLPLYKKTMSSQMKKKMVNTEVAVSTMIFAELLINQLSQPNNGLALNIKNRKVIMVKYNVSLKVDI